MKFLVLFKFANRERPHRSRFALMYALRKAFALAVFCPLNLLAGSYVLDNDGTTSDNFGTVSFPASFTGSLSTGNGWVPFNGYAPFQFVAPASGVYNMSLEIRRNNGTQISAAASIRTALGAATPYEVIDSGVTKAVSITKGTTYFVSMMIDKYGVDNAFDYSFTFSISAADALDYIVRFNMDKPSQVASNNGGADGVTQAHVKGRSKNLLRVHADLGWNFDGYRFVRWEYQPSTVILATYQDGESVRDVGSAAGTVDLHARWEFDPSLIGTYLVMFYKNDGSATVEAQRHKVGTSLNLTSSASLGWARSGCSFVGWSRTPDATTATYHDAESVRNLGTAGQIVSLYAIWQPISVSPTVVSLTVSGPTDVNAGDSAVYVCVANHSDGTTKLVSPEWTCFGAYASRNATRVSFVSIDASGRALFDGVPDVETAEISARHEGKTGKLVVRVSPVCGSPTGVQASGDNPDGVSIVWCPVAGASGYYVYRFDPSLLKTGYGGSRIASVVDTRYFDNTALSEHSYSYFVVPFKSVAGRDIEGMESVHVGGVRAASRRDETSATVLAGIGWHEVSFPVLPTGGDPADVFAPVEDKIGYVTYGSKNWSPATGGTLTALEIGKGYWVQTTAESVEWSVTGQGNPGVEIALKAGWNLIGYPLLEEGEVETVLATALATGKIDWIYSGSRVYPGTLTTLAPGKGYWVYANAAVTIRFDF